MLCMFPLRSKTEKLLRSTVTAYPNTATRGEIVLECAEVTKVLIDNDCLLEKPTESTGGL